MIPVFILMQGLVGIRDGIHRSVSENRARAAAEGAAEEAVAEDVVQ